MKIIIKILILRLEINRRVGNRSNSFSYVCLREYLIYLLDNRNRNKNRSKNRSKNKSRNRNRSKSKSKSIKNNKIIEIKRTHNYKNLPNPNQDQHPYQCQTQILSLKTTTQT